MNLRNPKVGPAPGRRLAGMLCVVGSGTRYRRARAVPKSTAARCAERMRRLPPFDRIAGYSSIGRLERYAASVAVRKTSLNRLCRLLGGRTAFDLIQQRLGVRGSGAGWCMPRKFGDGIAGELGFKGPCYFFSIFRRHSGVSPV